MTDFVEALQTELEATFKEDISIYFDKNPHDGLHETHDVDSSLKEKVKCVVFIPIVSQTYCDPNSFAWQKEFLSFIDFTKTDKFGLDIKLPNGNVAKRVLPVRIHDLDEVDKKLFEEQVGGVMRPVDFIYKESGVNRPLSLREENPSANLNQTYYKNQINKVANGIKEIITSLKYPEAKLTRSTNTNQPPANTASTKKLSTKKLVFISLGLMILFALIYAGFQFTSSPPQEPKIIDKSIAVLPFVNMSGDSEQEYFSDGMTEEIINQLSKITDLRVTSRTSVMGYKGTTKNTRLIAAELGVANVLEGSVRQSGDVLRISVNLVNGENDEPLWSTVIDKKLENIFAIQSSIAQNVAANLRIVISPEAKQQIEAIPTTNLEAYNLYLEGVHILWNNPELRDLSEAKLKQAIALDSNFASGYAFLARIVMERGFFGNTDAALVKLEALPLLNRAMEINEKDFFTNIFMANYQWWYNWDFKQAEFYLLKAAKLNPSSVGSYPVYGNFYYAMGKFEESARYSDICLRDNPTSPLSYQCSRAYVETNQTKRAMDVARRGIELFGLNFETLLFASTIYNNMGEYKQTLTLLEPVVSLQFQYNARLVSNLAVAYIHLNDTEKASKIVDELTKQGNAPLYNAGPYYHSAKIFAELENADGAFRWLEKSYLHREVDITFLKGEYSFNKLHSDPRWQILMDKIGFPK